MTKNKEKSNISKEKSNKKLEYNEQRDILISTKHAY